MSTLRILLTLCVGVAYLGVGKTAPSNDQSELAILEDQPMKSEENYEETRRMETPEVVLQLKYESGELNRIYLAQFRKGKEHWAPSVPARTNLCADLCHAGLGGPTCGPTCQGMLPVGLQEALESANHTDSVAGKPRVGVCPTLCSYNLGHPLCNCRSRDNSSVEWANVCSAFCLTDNFVLSGCPTCEETSTTDIPIAKTSSRILDTSEGWTAWCNVQCVQGQGGAACNCDRAPFQ